MADKKPFPPDLKFATNIPAQVRFKFGLDARTMFTPTDKMGAAWLYTVDVSEFVMAGTVVYAAGEGTLKATETLQAVLERSMIVRNTQVTITKAEQTIVKDDKPRQITVWKVQNGDVTYTSRDSVPTTEAATAHTDAGKPSPQSQLAPPPVTPPKAPISPPVPPQADASDPGPTATGEARTSKPATDDLPFVLMAAFDAALIVAKAVLLKHGITSEAEIGTTARGMSIDLRRSGWTPRPKHLEAMRGLLALSTPPAKSPPTSPADSPAGSDPADSDVWFDRCQNAQEAGITDVAFEKAAREIVARYMKTAKLPESYVMAGMPKACIPLIVAWINENAV
jgi:hypothetical protein